ncbi:MAG: hypothetical protein JWS10_3057 [Cypionkella sp.]|uniref:M10 family metallopeptidase C-terminal domain-containing protein n=1 Tax=Cypionkella sp. TaxID=2811411 RepID=UPI002609B81E|nr:M10 family metallopeptidase C-terminal domain-containing protein [Cypionkella sp.]MDB5660442.1 hypothetical protein [Cypionkella sp.]
MAILVASEAADMRVPSIWFGVLESFNSTHITIRAGLLSGTYRGNFSYDDFGNVFGQLNSYEIFYGGKLQVSITGLNLDAYDYMTLINDGAAVQLYEMAFARNDKMSGSVFADALVGFAGNDSLLGNAGNDTLFGGSGNDALEGGSGSDRLIGGTGNDTYVRGTGDQIFEDAGAGKDTVRSSTSYVLGANLEVLILTGSAANGGGNALANSITGNNASNALSGNAGNDIIYAGGGRDTLSGGAGSDKSYGGTDGLADVFVFTAASHTAVGASRDVVYNFTRGADDIDLRTIDARSATSATNDAFLFSGKTAQAHSIWFSAEGSNVIVKGDVNGDRVADFEIQVIGVSSVGASDFLL